MEEGGAEGGGPSAQPLPHGGRDLVGTALVVTRNDSTRFRVLVVKQQKG